MAQFGSLGKVSDVFIRSTEFSFRRHQTDVRRWLTASRMSLAASGFHPCGVRPSM
ncbi:MAG: hypothetical protein QOD39_1824 [Mycobacterium sp.]|nr:hypothetical protein [Mycobacterium sp.]